MTLLKIGTRGSPLAMWQADYVRRALLQAHPGIQVELQVIRTTGDVQPDQPLARIGGIGVFTKEIENALLRRRVDVAVHSLKDLPTRPALRSSAASAFADLSSVALVEVEAAADKSAGGLRLAAILAREDPADALVARERWTLAQLPAGAKLLAGSPRRRAQLLHRRPDLNIAPVRGNVQSRLKKFDEAGAHAIVLARAGMVRLNLSDRITERLDPTDFLPACGQGALALEVRADDDRAAEICGALDDPSARLATTAERAFLAGLGGGCLAPVGAYGRLTPGPKQLTLTGMVASPDGSRLIRRTVEGAAGEPAEAVALGERLAERLRTEGAEEILRDVASRSATRLGEGP